MQVQFLKRPAAAVFAAILLIFSVPASAAESDYSGSVNGFWNSYLYSWAQGYSGIPLIGDAVQSVVGAFCSDVCSSSSDALHHASSVSSDIGSDEYGFFAMATCDYCHARFKVYGSDLSTAYDTYVEELPVSGLRSDGYLYWSPVYTDFRFYSSSTAVQMRYSSDSSRFTADFLSDRLSFTFTYSYSYGFNDSYFYIDGVYPVTGYYSLSVAPSSEIVLLDKNGGSHSFASYYGASGSYGPSSGLLEAGSSFNFCWYFFTLSGQSASSTSFASGHVTYPVIQIKPLSGLIDPVGDTTYNINSRPTSITGDYGIIGDNGQITKVDNNTIVNETNNTIYNPVTDTTTPITSWSYDYSDRSYNVVTESGDTITVTYGDENITIHEGDTVYNVYYLVDSSGSSGEGGTDIPSSCNHDYTSTVTTAATCEAPGLRTYTCSKCGNTYTEKIPATGHTWTVKQSVATEYDEDGNITQQGYTIYKCAVCGTEYKDEAGTGPPNNSVDNTGDGESLWDKLGALIGTVGNGILSLIDAVAGKLLDGLISLADMISGKFSQVVELILSWFDEIPALFGGFLDFLGAVFPFIPEEAMLLLTFGIAVIVFIGIIKALRR